MAISSSEVQNARDELRAIYEEFAKSFDDADFALVERYLDKRFVYVDHNGLVRDYDQYKALYDTIPDGYRGVHEFKAFDVELLGDGSVALVTGTYYARMEFADFDVEEDVRVVAVWERQDDGWKRVIDQMVAYDPKVA